MGDSTVSAEQRCLKLVAMAEAAAKEEKRKMLAHIRALEQQLSERDEQSNSELARWERRLEEATRSVAESAHFFEQRYSETRRLLEAQALERSSSEARLIANIKDLLFWFHKYQQFERKRRVQGAFASIKSHQGSGRPALRSSAEVAPTSEGEGGRAVRTHGTVSFSDFLDYLGRRRARWSPALGEGIIGGAGEQGPQPSEGPSPCPTPKGAPRPFDGDRGPRAHTRAVLGEVMAAPPPTSHPPSSSSTPPPQRHHQQQPQPGWCPTAVEERLIEKLIENAPPIESRTLLRFATDDVDDETEVPFSMQSVLLYLCGAVEMLESFCTRICAVGAHFADEARARIAGRLLDEERALLRQTVAPLAAPVVDISPAALSVVLLQGLRDDREERATRVFAALGDAIQSQAARARSVLAHTTRFYTEQLLPMVADGLYVTRSDYARRLRADRQLAPGSAASGLVGQLPMECDDLVEVDDALPLPPVASSQSPTASAAAARENRSGARRHAPRQGTGEVVLLVPRANQQLVAFARAVGSMEANALRRLAEQHNEDYAQLRGEYQALFDRMLKRAHSEREIVFVHRVLAFNLDDVHGDAERRMLMTQVQMERQRTTNERNRNEVVALQAQLQDLEEVIRRLKKENVALQEDAAKAQRDANAFAEVARDRQVLASSGVAVGQQGLREEVRVINYCINVESFGETWQESLLKLRERTLHEIASENQRTVSRVRNLVRRSEADANNLESLFEARLQNAVSEMEHDNTLKFALLNKRHELERQRIHDEFTSRLQRQQQDHDSEVELLRGTFEKEYLRKVEELNELYDSRVRRMQQRRECEAQRFSETLRTYRQQFRDREKEVEDRFSARFTKMFAYFEEEAQMLKDHYAERQRELDKERIVVQTNVERRINEKVQELRAEFDDLARKLQQLTLAFLESQRKEFEEYREVEMENVRQSRQIDASMHKIEAMDHLRQLQRNHELAVREIRRQHEADLLFQKRALEESYRERENMLEERLLTMKDRQEDVLRITQDMRVEQDEAFWNTCHDNLVEADRLVIEQKSKVELLIQQRYSDLVQACEELLSKEFAARRESFDREMKIRTQQFHQYCHHYHLIQLRLEKEMWLEVAERGMVEKEAASIMFSLRVMEGERRRNLEVILDRQRLPFEEIGLITFDKLRETREEYEGRLKEAHSYSAAIMRDYITALEVELRNNSNKLQVMDSALSAQVFATVDALTHKAELYNQSRQFIVENRLDGVVALAEQCLRSAGLADSRSYFRQLSLLHHQQDVADDRGGAEPRGRRQGLRRSEPRTGHGGTPASPQQQQQPQEQRRRQRAKTLSPPSSVSEARARARGRDSGASTPLRERGDLNAESTPTRRVVRFGVTANERAATPTARPAGAPPPSTPTSQSLALIPVDADVRATAYLAEDVRVLEYFTHMKEVVKRAMSELATTLEERLHQYEQQRRSAFRGVHEEYVETTSALMKRMEHMQRERDLHAITVEQLESQLVAKDAEILQATAIRADLEGVLARELVQKQRKLREDMTIGTLELDPEDARGGGADGVYSLASSPAQAFFRSGGGAASITRDGARRLLPHQQLVTLPRSVLMDLAALRERVFCNEWLHFTMRSDWLLTASDAARASESTRNGGRGRRSPWTSAARGECDQETDNLDGDDDDGDDDDGGSTPLRGFGALRSNQALDSTLRAAATDLQRDVVGEQSDWRRFASALATPASARPNGGGGGAGQKAISGRTPTSAKPRSLGASRVGTTTTTAGAGAGATVKPKWSN